MEGSRRLERRVRWKRLFKEIEQAIADIDVARPSRIPESLAIDFGQIDFQTPLSAVFFGGLACCSSRKGREAASGAAGAATNEVAGSSPAGPASFQITCVSPD